MQLLFRCVLSMDCEEGGLRVWTIAARDLRAPAPRPGHEAAHVERWDRRDGRILRYKRRRSLVARGSALEIKELKSFCMVARLGSFSKASQMLAMGQSAVTKHIQRLEGELGEALVERGGRPIRLTPAGANLFRIALPLVEGIEDLTHRAAPSATEPPVTVAVPHGFIGHVLLEAVREMRRLGPPSRSIRIRSGTKDETFNLVQSGAVDFAIAPNPGQLARFKFTPLFPS